MGKERFIFQTMTKRLYIIVEGQTEQGFVFDLMAPFFLRYNIYVYPVLIQTSKGHKGGFVSYQHLKNDINRLLKSQGQDIIVTTFVDFFRCPELPDKDSWCHIPDHRLQVKEMEDAIRRDINDRRFYPYIQLHEFETVLFSSDKGFNTYYDDSVNHKIHEIIASYPNPEDINSTPEGAPSKRILKIIPDFDKVTNGIIIALEIGMETIMERCPRFRNWINTLINLCRE